MRRALAAATRAALLALATAGSDGHAAVVDFIALGDMPYGSELTTGPAYRRLIELINAERPAFSLHLGDFTDGLSDCSDALYARQAAYFQRYTGPVVYTPGDNDWFDCGRRGADALARLQALRERFFGQPRSLGRQGLAVQRQADLMPEHGRYRENLRWWQQDVLFISIHTVGPDNGRQAAQPALRAEWRAREAANAAWIRAAFVLARERHASALVLATQADVLRYPQGRQRPLVEAGFVQSVRDTLLPLAQEAPFPVLLVHGDSHQFTWDQPFQNPQGSTITNLWRLQVFGDPQMHAVKVHIDTAATPPFSVAPLWNPLSPDPRR